MAWPQLGLCVDRHLPRSFGRSVYWLRVVTDQPSRSVRDVDSFRPALANHLGRNRLVRCRKTVEAFFQCVRWRREIMLANPNACDLPVSRADDQRCAART